MRRFAFALSLTAAHLAGTAVAARAQDQHAAATSTVGVVGAAAAVAATAQDAARIVPVSVSPPASAAAEPAVEKSAVEKPAAPKPPVTRLVATIDLSTQRMTVAVDGSTAYVWPISSGRAGFLTPTGSFRPQWASKMHYSKKYDLAPMPYSVFFNGGIATHGTSAVGMLGQPASHGCIRLTTANAQTFFNLVHRHGFASTRIVVRGSTPAPAIARRRPFDAEPRVARTERGPRTRIAAPRPIYVQPPYAQPPRIVRYYAAPGYGYGNHVYVARPQPRYLFSNW